MQGDWKIDKRDDAAEKLCDRVTRRGETADHEHGEQEQGNKAIVVFYSRGAGLWSRLE